MAAAARRAGRPGVVEYDLAASGIGMYITQHVVDAVLAADHDGDLGCRGPPGALDETDTDSPAPPSTYTTLQAHRALYTATPRRPEGGDAHRRVYRLTAKPADATPPAPAPAPPIHWLLWATSAVFGAVALAALLHALAVGGVFGACACDAEAVAAARTAETSALQAIVSRHEAILRDRIAAELVLFTLATTETGPALHLTPPTGAQHSDGLVIDGPVSMAGVAMAPLAARFAAAQASLGGRVAALETRLAGTTQCRLVADNRSMTGLGLNMNHWHGSVVGPDSRIYGLPFTSDAVLIADPAAATTDTTTLRGLGVAEAKWASGVTAANGLIYGIPYHAAAVLLINPAAQTWDAVAIGGFPTGGAKWMGAVQSPDTGLLFAMPHSGSAVLVINPATNATDTAVFGDLGLASYKYVGCVYAPQTHKIYGIPCTAAAMLVIDPRTNRSDLVPVPAEDAVPCKWAGGVAGLDGRIYGVPNDGTTVLVFNPATNASDTSTLSGLPAQVYKWYSGALSSTGRIFCAPTFAGAVLVIDPVRGTMHTELTGLTTGGGVRKWNSCEVVHDALYCIPGNADHVLVVRRECTATVAPL